MGSFLALNASVSSLTWRKSIFTCRKWFGFYDAQKCLPSNSCSVKGFASRTRAFASRNSAKRLRKERVESVRVVDETSAGSENVQNFEKVEISDDSAAESRISIPSRGAVLQACIVTSGLIAALGVLIRQVSHAASIEGLPVIDCSMEVSFEFQTWHFQLIAGLVILISSRYLLLKTWPEFAESSQAANQQVLTSLQPLDFVIVAFLPGFSEEFLFRGALQPLFGSNLTSALGVALVFGALHLGSGRKYSFAVWACLVGFLYGYTTIASSSIVVPMVSHAMNNLVGGIIWKYSSDSSQQISDTN